MVGIGNQLRLAREAQGKSLQDASAELRIGVHLLEALEQENYDAFSAQVYAFAFLRSYAKYLGLNEDATVQYIKDAMEKAEESVRVEQDIMDLSVEEPISRPVIIGAGILAFVGVIFVWSQLAPPSYEGPQIIDGKINLPAVAPAPAENPQSTDAPSDRALKSNAVNPSDEALAGADGTEIKADAENAGAQNVNVESADVENANVETDNVESDNVESANVESDVANLASSGNVAPENSADSSERQESGEQLAAAQPRVKQPEIRLFALRTTWIRVSDDSGTVLFSSIIDAGDSYKLSASRNVYIAARDAGAIDIRRDGQSVERLGRPGEVVARRLIEWSRIAN